MSGIWCSIVDVRRILDGMEVFHHLLGASNSSATVRYAIRALSIELSNRDMMETPEGLRSILRVLSSTDVESRRAAAGVNLSIDHAHKVNVRQAGGSLPLIKSVSESRDAETQRYSVRALYNLAMNKDNTGEIIALGGLPPVVGAALHPEGTGPGTTETRHFAIGTILLLCQTEGGRADAKKCGIVSTDLVRCVEDPDQVSTLRLLAALTADVEITVVLSLAGTVRQIAPFVLGKDDELALLSLKVLHGGAASFRYE